jgi:hypothetical protein
VLKINRKNNYKNMNYLRRRLRDVALLLQSVIDIPSMNVHHAEVLQHTDMKAALLDLIRAANSAKCGW